MVHIMNCVLATVVSVPHHFNAIDAAQVNVHQNHIGMANGQPLKGLLTADTGTAELAFIRHP